VRGYANGRLLGADNDDLVFAQPDGSWTVLHRVAAANVIENQNDGEPSRHRLISTTSPSSRDKLLSRYRQ
jgi:hypothetical protein